MFNIILEVKEYYIFFFCTMARIKDLIVVPVITIPILIYCLIFQRDEHELIFGLSVFTVGVILYRIFNLRVIGAVIFTIGVLFMFLADRDYEKGRFSFITKYSNPIFLKYYDMFILSLKRIFNPLYEFQYYNILSDVFYWILVGIWLLVLVLVLFRINRNFISFLFSLIIPIVIFVICYVWPGEKNRFL